MEQVERHFKNTFEKSGIALTVSQCLSFARERKLRVNRKQVSDFVSKQLLVAKFAPVRRPTKFQSIGVLRPGVFFIDYGEYKKKDARFNEGHTGFLVAAENVTNKLFVKPCRDKSTKSWLDAIRDFVELTRNVSVIFSDRDSVATAPAFKNEISHKYGFRWFFLKKGSKSFLAERYIRFVKEKLSQALLKKDTNNWLQFVPDLVKEYNSQLIEGTSYRRRAVTQKNFYHFLSQVLKVKDPELEFNSSRAGPFEQESWNKKIFKFELGQKVLLAQKANWKNKANFFAKPSVEGGFSTSTYTISARQLRKTKGLRDFVAVYSLREMGPSIHFYDSELKSVRED